MKIKLLTTIIVCCSLRAVSQVTTPANAGAATDYVGWNAAQAFPLSIKHEGNQPINFYTNAGAGTFNNQRMIININGNIGIGTNFTNPLHLLDVRNGDINVGQGLAGGNPNSPQAYRIGSQIVLWNNGNQSNIFVGGSAGTFNTTGNSNSFVGRLAGFSNTTGSRNTAMGFEVFRNNSSGNENTAIGDRAMLNNTFSGGNTAVGFEALRDNTNFGGNTGIGWRALWRNQSFASTAVGAEAMRFNQTAFQNTAIGAEALRNNVDGIQNVAVGYQALRNTVGNQTNLDGEENTAVGNQTLRNNTIGRRNTALGDETLFQNTIGIFNTGLGSETLGRNISGNHNVGVGSSTLGRNTIGNFNNVVGDSALFWTRTGNRNTASGYKAGFGVLNNSHSNNCFFGFYSGRDITTGASNTFVGFLSGLTNSTGSRNVLVGQQSALGANNLNNAIAIGSEAIVTESNKMILGNDSVNVGIGLSNDVTTANFFGPNNKLEIDAGLNGHNPSTGGVTGLSGLRFRDLHAGGNNYQGLAVTENTTVVNPFTTPAVLSVDVNGDVILVQDIGGGTGTGFGLCTNPTQLTSDAGIDLNANNLVFLGQGPTGYQVGIGTGCTPQAKLEVLQTSGNALSIGILSTNSDKDGIAVKAISNGIPSGNYTQVAGWFQVPATPIFNEVAIFVPQNGGVVDIGYPSPSFVGLGNNSGSLNVRGTIFGNNGTWQSSDSALKHNIEPLTSSLNKIVQLNPIQFEWDSIADSLMLGVQFGFTAQQVKNVIPELVHHVQGTDAISYTQLIPFIVDGIQQQQLSIDSLRNETSANVCAGITTDYISKWSGTDLCNSQLFDNGFNAGIGGTSSNTLFRVYNTSASSRSLAGEFITSLSGNSLTNAGLIAQAEGSTFNNIGLSAAAINSGAVASSNHGIQSYAAGASLENFAGLFVADQPTASPGSTSFALYAQTTGAADVNYGIFAKAGGASTANYAGYFDGDVVRTGTDNFTSDIMLKQNIDSINGALNTLMQLKPKAFDYKQSSFPSMNLPGGKQYGLIAQDVQSVLPEIINNTVHPAVRDSAGNVIHPAVSYLSLEYQQLTAIMIKAIQEQQAQIDSMKAVMTACCTNNSKTSGNSYSANAMDVELSDADAIVLNQNVPNPFAEQTTINYNIPKNTSAAQILFYDINGRQIKAVDITKKGKGQLNVFANDLSNGIYSYTLIVDGKIFETKKMIKQQ